MKAWQNPTLGTGERVEALLAEMTLTEKIAQLGAYWDHSKETDVASVGLTEVNPEGQVAPDAFTGAEPEGQVAPDAGAAQSETFEKAAVHGLGHITRVFGTRPVSVEQGMAEQAYYQNFLIDNTRLGIPAIVHEECLAGLTAYSATAYPVPPSWGASFDPELAYAIGKAIGQDMRELGVHQGLAPLLDVTRDYRWGRVEETVGEDPYLVGTIGTAYVRGLQTSGIDATLKHFAGYPASKAARNHAPVSMGWRELRDVMLTPFEMAVRVGGARSVMNSYCDIDGVPALASGKLLTDILRGEWGFSGTVVSDYWAVPFLHREHLIAPTLGKAAAIALEAGLDVELPDSTGVSELKPLVESGQVPLELIDQAVRRVLRAKCRHGLLDEGWRSPAPESIDLDKGTSRELARWGAEEAVVLLANDGILPLTSPGRVAVIGPVAGEPRTLFGCYSFPNHVLSRYQGAPLGIAAASILDKLGERFTCEYVPGTDFRDPDESGIQGAVEAAKNADVVILTLGDIAGLFDRGTSGEGCDAETLELPGAQAKLADAILALGKPVIMLLVSGRPYALGRYAPRVNAIVQAFMPGEEGAGAIVDVITGAREPIGHLPLSIPNHVGGQPGTYLGGKLAQASAGISNLDPTPLYPFGYGLSYTSFAYGSLSLSADSIPSDGTVEVYVEVRNTGSRFGVAVPQLYLSDEYAEVVRPVKQLVGFARVELEPGQTKRVTWQLHADRTAFVGAAERFIVEPGKFKLAVGEHAGEPRLETEFEITGERRDVHTGRILETPTEVETC
ncbi:MAG: glycoside hydrolase family 3 C-terminal domain-containing protein [Propionibacteriaceae bacterium]|jgi:beta-glucosidase|nr:glycoside hydrolase family 3 C-terminal domain-containing protein [Propionibacteriaceae bacterium]